MKACLGPEGHNKYGIRKPTSTNLLVLTTVNVLEVLLLVDGVQKRLVAVFEAQLGHKSLDLCPVSICQMVVFVMNGITLQSCSVPRMALRIARVSVNFSRPAAILTLVSSCAAFNTLK